MKYITFCYSSQTLDQFYFNKTILFSVLVLGEGEEKTDRHLVKQRQKSAHGNDIGISRYFIMYYVSMACEISTNPILMGA